MSRVSRIIILKVNGFGGESKTKFEVLDNRMVSTRDGIDDNRLVASSSSEECVWYSLVVGKEKGFALQDSEMGVEVWVRCYPPFRWERRVKICGFSLSYVWHFEESPGGDYIIAESDGSFVVRSGSWKSSSKVTGAEPEIYY